MMQLERMGQPATLGVRVQTMARGGREVRLEPGHSPLDWARLQSSRANLRGLADPQMLRVDPATLRLHRTRATGHWTAIRGRVYHITPYLSFHPGGPGKLIAVAGRDGTAEFMETHAWINVETMLQACLVGFMHYS